MILSIFVECLLRSSWVFAACLPTWFCLSPYSSCNIIGNFEVTTYYRKQFRAICTNIFWIFWHYLQTVGMSLELVCCCYYAFYKWNGAFEELVVEQFFCSESHSKLILSILGFSSKCRTCGTTVYEFIREKYNQT